MRAVVFVDEIPRFPAGKILRRVLADRERGAAVAAGLSAHRSASLTLGRCFARAL